MTLSMWTCSCGRRVPATVAQCRCGKPRPEAGETLGVLALVGLYFGSRMLNRHNASKEARGAAVQGLSQVLDKQQASDMVRRHQYYKTGWGRRQSSSFETQKYAKCVIDKVTADLERESTALRRATAPTPPPTPEAALRGEWGQATLGDVKVTEWQRAPQLKVGAEFLVLGAKLTQRASRVFQVNCEEQPPGKTVVVGCALQVDGPKATGTVRYSYDVPGPPKASCNLSLQLSDGYSTRTNTVVVPLR